MENYMISGRKKKRDEAPAVIPSLVQLCSQRIRDTIHLNSIKQKLSVVPNELLELLLVGCGPDQLMKIESYAQRDLSYVTEDLWQVHCRNFLNKEVEDCGASDSWRDHYQELVEEYENKKIQLGKHLRSMYNEKEKEKASKKIKILDSAPVNKYRSQTKLGTTYTGYAKVVSKPMEKCLKDMRKTQASMSWRKPTAPQPVALSKPLPPKFTPPAQKLSSSGNSLKPPTPLPMGNLHKPFPPKNPVNVATKPATGQMKPNISLPAKSTMTTNSFLNTKPTINKSQNISKPAINNNIPSVKKPTPSSVPQNIAKSPLSKPALPTKVMSQSTKSGQFTNSHPPARSNISGKSFK